MRIKYKTHIKYVAQHFYKTRTQQMVLVIIITIKVSNYIDGCFFKVNFHIFS